MYLQHLLQAMMGAEELLAALFLLPHNLMSPSTLGERYPTKGFNNLIFLQCFHFKKKVFIVINWAKHFSQCMSSHVKVKKEVNCSSICSVADVDQALEQHVIVYNPLAWNITTIVNVTVTQPSAAVFDDDGQPVPAQVLLFWWFLYMLIGEWEICAEIYRNVQTCMKMQYMMGVSSLL